MSEPPGIAGVAEIAPETVDAMTAELAAGGAMPIIQRLYLGRDRRAPLVRWSPAADELPVDGLRFLLGCWQASRGEAELPAVAAIDPFRLKPVLGNLIILDVIDGGADFRFRLYGSILAESARFDWTGSTVDQMRRTLKGAGPALYLASYRAMLGRRQPLYTASPALGAFQRGAWGRLVLPYGDAAVERLLVGNYFLNDDFGPGDSEAISQKEEGRAAGMRDEMRAALNRLQDED